MTSVIVFKKILYKKKQDGQEVANETVQKFVRESGQEVVHKSGQEIVYEIGQDVVHTVGQEVVTLQPILKIARH